MTYANGVELLFAPVCLINEFDEEGWVYLIRHTESGKTLKGALGLDVCFLANGPTDEMGIYRNEDETDEAYAQRVLEAFEDRVIG